MFVQFSSVFLLFSQHQSKVQIFLCASGLRGHTRTPLCIANVLFLLLSSKHFRD